MASSDNWFLKPSKTHGHHIRGYSPNSVLERPCQSSFPRSPISVLGVADSLKSEIPDEVFKIEYVPNLIVLFLAKNILMRIVVSKMCHKYLFMRNAFVMMNIMALI